MSLPLRRKVLCLKMKSDVSGIIYPTKVYYVKAGTTLVRGVWGKQTISSLFSQSIYSKGERNKEQIANK